MRGVKGLNIQTLGAKSGELWNYCKGDKFTFLLEKQGRLATYLGHLLVGDEELLVLGVLQVVLLDVGPQLLDAFGTAGLLLADDVSQLRAELHGLGENGFLGHVEFGGWF